MLISQFLEIKKTCICMSGHRVQHGHIARAVSCIVYGPDLWFMAWFINFFLAEMQRECLEV